MDPRPSLKSAHSRTQSLTRSPCPPRSYATARSSRYNADVLGAETEAEDRARSLVNTATPPAANSHRRFPFVPGGASRHGRRRSRLRINSVDYSSPSNPPQLLIPRRNTAGRRLHPVSSLRHQRGPGSGGTFWSGASIVRY